MLHENEIYLFSLYLVKWHHHDVIIYVGFVFIMIVFTKEVKLVITFLKETKRYGAKRY